jgi:hypothetical protein
LPDTLTHLKNLLYLDIGNNLLTSLPSDINRLENLTYLIADQDSLSGIPESIALLPFLKELQLSGNRIAALPFSIAAMDGLEVLDISINDLTTLPDEWVLLVGLKSLDIGGNQLCSLSPALTQWADSKQPSWLNAQVCAPIGQGAAIRRSAQTVHPIQTGSERFWVAGNGMKVSNSVSIYNVRGQIVRVHPPGIVR